jgi:hypothetical protein
MHFLHEGHFEGQASIDILRNSIGNIVNGSGGAEYPTFPPDSTQGDWEKLCETYCREDGLFNYAALCDVIDEAFAAKVCTVEEPFHEPLVNVVTTFQT